MRSSNTQKPRSNSDTTIAPTSILTIQITELASATKRETRKGSKYRPIQRIDGVIIESPRYQPSPSPSLSPSLSPALSTKTFVPKSLVINPPIKPISQHLRIQQLREINLRGIREFDAELAKQKRRDGSDQLMNCGHDGNGVVVNSGRGGYNGPTKAHESTPMERFMQEEGPWTTFSPRLNSMFP